MAKDVWNARSWRERLGYVVRPPGWTPAAPKPIEPAASALPQATSAM